MPATARLCIVVALLCTVHAQPPVPQDFSPPEDHLPDLIKRALEYPMGDEADQVPSCSELRAIWRLTKRAARHSLLTNEIPTDNYFGYVLRSPLPPSGTPSNGESFGRIILEPNSKHSVRGRHPGVYGHRVPPRVGSSFDSVAQQLRRGTFLDRPFRLAKWSAADRFRKPVHHVHDYMDDHAFPQVSGYRRPHKAGMGMRSKGKPSPELTAAADRIIRQALAEMAAADNKITYGRDAGNGFTNHDLTAVGYDNESSGCGNAATKTCRTNADCECLGFYACARGRCKSYKPISGKATTHSDNAKSRWQERPLSNAAQSVIRHKRRKEAPPDNALLEP